MPAGQTERSAGSDVVSDVGGAMTIAGGQSRWLTGARIGWVALVALSLALYAIMTPIYVSLVQQVCVGGACQLTPQQAHALLRLGVSLQTYALASVALNLLFALVSCLIAALLFWRRSTDWMALLVGLLLVMISSNNVTGVIGGSARQPWHTLALIIDIANLAMLVLVFTLFPNGRFVPRWSRWLAPAWLVVQLPLAVIPSATIPDWLDGLIYLGVFGAVIGSQIYRYRTKADSVQRMQTKWVVMGIVTTLLIDLALYQPYIFAPALRAPDSLYPIAAEALFHLVVLLIPISFGVAILRFRLYDFDIIINRAIVYGLLTTILAAVYAGLVLGVQLLVSIVTQQDTSTLAIVASTLAISALFQPLRRLLQNTIDRRFFRSKFDATKTVAAFGATLRSEISLTELRDHLTDVVAQTMHPTHISLWMRPVSHQPDTQSEPSRYFSAPQPPQP
ncbi:MAG TPA: hypothetical protein VE338_01015 [Ktedonobacterales bacterium]|nr:hypothetical protein [Ktedonobacterales bacterium]